VEGGNMTTIQDVLKSLNPLKRVQYLWLLRNIETRSVEFGTDHQKELQKDLGLTQNEFKKAMEWLIDANLICIEASYRQIVFSLTDAARDII